MTTEILPGFARANVGWLRQALEERRGRLSQEEGRALACLCGHIAGLFRGLGDVLHQRLRGGVESRALLAELRGIVSAAEEALAQFAALREQIGAAVGTPAGLSSLDEATAAVEAVRAELGSIAAWVDSPVPPPDLERLQSAQAGPFVRLEDLKARRAQGQ
jgi:hypothetical protein